MRKTFFLILLLSLVFGFPAWDLEAQSRPSFGQRCKEAAAFLAKALSGRTYVMFDENAHPHEVRLHFRDAFQSFRGGPVIRRVYSDPTGPNEQGIYNLDAGTQPIAQDLEVSLDGLIPANQPDRKELAEQLAKVNKSLREILPTVQALQKLRKEIMNQPFFVEVLPDQENRLVTSHRVPANPEEVMAEVESRADQFYEIFSLFFQTPTYEFLREEFFEVFAFMSESDRNIWVKEILHLANLAENLVQHDIEKRALINRLQNQLALVLAVPGGNAVAEENPLVARKQPVIDWERGEAFYASHAD